ncbi:MAG: tetratricopeptide repeat protein [Pirellulaceae bacterium]
MRAVCARWLPILLLSTCLVSECYAQEYDKAQMLFFSGEYQQCLDEVEFALGSGDEEEKWHLLNIDCLMNMGQYDKAREALEEGLLVNPNSIRLRLAGYEVWKYNNNLSRGKELLVEFDDLVQYRRWRYRDALNQVVQGQYLLEMRADAREVLDRFLLPVTQNSPNVAEAWLAIGELGLAKHDYALAAEHFDRATQLEPENPAGFLGLAQAWRPSDLEKSSEALNASMALNPNYIPGLLYLVNDRIDSERYNDALAFIERIHAINPRHPEAWAYRAVVAHLLNVPDEETTSREQAFAAWEGNPHIDHLIGRKLSQKYRFAEGARLQRRALTYDTTYLPAKLQLANDLLRLGNDEQPWRLADEVYADDGYNVVAYNLVTLGNDLDDFAVLQRDGFILRMEPHEASVYGTEVLDLLVAARSELSSKYDVQVAEPIFVEIFPKQKDFAIRTFGLPGGAGYLGVCFGRVITMNSPATQSRTGSNWKAVLWHEFCHVVTLQKTSNKMPRWLSEGISVYEESQRDPAWGQSMTPEYREMILGDDLTPVSELSGVFLKPDSGQHLQFAYYESSLVVEYLIEKYGVDTLKRILDDLQMGMPINDTLGRYTGDVKLLDKEFADYARQRARDLAPLADWEQPELPASATLEQWQQWNDDHPDNFYGLKAVATLLVREQKWDEAESVLQRLLEVFPDYRGSDNAYSLLAVVARGRGDTDREIEMLQKSADLQSGAIDVYQRVASLASEREDWTDVIRQAGRLLAVNPLVPGPHRLLAHAAEQTGDHVSAVKSLQALTQLDPIDPAETYFRYAQALYRNGQTEMARRQVLKCLEEAPRYREAHQLLLELKAADKEISAGQEPNEGIRE